MVTRKLAEFVADLKYVELPQSTIGMGRRLQFGS